MKLQSESLRGIISGKEGLKERINELVSSSTKAVIITHRNADPDAVASAFIIAYALKALGVDANILIPEGPSRTSKRVLNELGLDSDYMIDDDRIQQVDLAVTVDSANPVQLGSSINVFRSAKFRVVIDHHKGNSLRKEATLSLVYSYIPSTTEIIVSLLELIGVNIVRNDIATLGIIGILYDTRRFMNAEASTFKAILKLIEWGGDYRRAISLLTTPQEKSDLSERVAKLKALSRLILEKTCGDILVAVTHIGSHESTVARTLIDLGADIAIVATSRDTEKRVSIRTSKNALNRGIRASTLAEYIAGKFNGEGGGHDTAAMTHLKYTGSIEELTASIARSLPGRIARLCAPALED